MKRKITTSLLVLSLMFFSIFNFANACCDGAVGYYNGMKPGYYGNEYYGGGLIYYPNDQFFTNLRTKYTYEDRYAYDCRAVPGNCCGNRCYRAYRVVKKYRHCKFVAGHTSKCGRWIRGHHVCWN